MWNEIFKRGTRWFQNFFAEAFIFRSHTWYIHLCNLLRDSRPWSTYTIHMTVFLDLCGTDWVPMRFSRPVHDRSCEPRPGARSEVVLYVEVMRLGSCEGGWDFYGGLELNKSHSDCIQFIYRSFIDQPAGFWLVYLEFAGSWPVAGLIFHYWRSQCNPRWGGSGGWVEWICSLRGAPE